MVFYADAALYIWQLFQDWTKTIFVVPYQNTEMLWLLVPVWLGWFFAEFFQEKRGTSMGNAITNAVIILWGSIDCARQTVRLMTEGTLTNNWDIVLRFVLIGMIFAYGGLIVYLGIKGRTIIKYIGRVREVTYVFAMFVPIFYNAIPFSLDHIIAALLFFPLFYFIIELLDRYTPNPKAMIEDLGQKESLDKDPFADLNLSQPAKDPFAQKAPSSPTYSNPPYNNQRYPPTQGGFR